MRRPFGRMPAIGLAALALAALPAAAGTSVAAASSQISSGQSQNWAGYVAQQAAGGQSFTSVSGSWVQPAVDASSGDGSSAFWVGLGGASDSSQALEQVGTEATTENGRTEYSAWYELVPKAPVALDLAIHPGDHISARVTVNGTTVVTSLADTTTGQSATKTLQMSSPDTSSAEWIAEAPAQQTAGGELTVLPLADFGKVAFTDATATAAGHTGSIDDASWATERVDLDSGSGSGFVGPGGSFGGYGAADGTQSASGGATTSSLSDAGQAFSVSYDTSAAASSDAGSGYDGYGYGSGDGGSGYGDGGYGYGGGGYGYGWSDGGYGYGGYGGGYSPYAYGYGA